MHSVLCRRPRLPAAAAAILCLLAARAAWAGWVDTREDGTTVIHIVLSQHVMPDPTMTDTMNVAGVTAVKKFKERFPEIFEAKYRKKYEADPETYGRFNWKKVAVELHSFSGIKVEGAESDLLAIAGGQAPDVLEINFRKSGNYIEEDFLYPLDKPEDGYLAGMTPDETGFRIHPKLWPIIKRRGADKHKRVWLLPFGGALGKVLLYRKDLFDEKAIPYPNEHWTWDDLLTASKQLTDSKRGTYGILFGQHQHEAWYWMTFLWSAGGEAMVYHEETDQWECVFDTREAAVALEFYTRLCTEKWQSADGKTHRGYAYKDEIKGTTKWQRGEIGMQFANIDGKLFSTINPELTGMAPVPLGPTGMRASELNSGLMGLFAQIKLRAVRDAAWEYMRYYDCEEAVAIKTDVMVAGGLGRFINPKYLRQFGYPEVERLAPKGWARIFEIAIETSRPEPYGKNSNLAYKFMTFPLKKAEQMALDEQFPADYEQRLEAIRQLLRDGNERANDVMMGIITPAERRTRNITAVIVLTSLVITLGLIFRTIFKIFTPPKLAGIEQARWNFRKYAWAYILLLPAAATVLLWQYVPLARGSVMAFQDYRILRQTTWVWVQNFGDLLWDSFWWTSVWNALRYSGLVIGLTFMPPILLAILLQEVPRGRLLFRTVFYLPAVTTGLVTILLWKQFYEPNEHGALNALVMRIPAAAFLAVGSVLGLIALAFARRMVYHRMLLAGWLFALSGAVLFVTCASMAWPILVPMGSSTGEMLKASWPAVLLGVGLVALGGIALAAILRRRRAGGQAAARLPWGSIVAGGALAVGLVVLAILTRGRLLAGAESFALAVGRMAVRLPKGTSEPFRWLTDPKMAMTACVIPMVWAGVGPGCLIYLAALKGIPEDLYEAADIDGATFLDKIMFVVFPMLKPLIIINFIGVFIGAWYGATGRILAMTGGGANTEVAGLYIFKKAYIYLRFGPATAMAWVLAFMLIGFTVHQLRILSRLEFRTTGDKK